MSWRQLLGVMPRLLYQGVGASLLDLEICYVRTHVGTPDHRDGHQTCYSGPPPLVRRGRPKAKLLNTLNQAVLFSQAQMLTVLISLSHTWPHALSISSTRRPGHLRPARALHLGKTGALQRCAGATVLPRRVEHALRDPREQPWLHHLVSRATASGRVRVGPGPTAVARPPIGTGAHACMCACTRACSCTV